MLPHQPGREVQAAGAYFWWFCFPHQVSPVREQSCPGARHGSKKFRSDSVPVPHISVKYPMWYHGCFLRKPLSQTPLPLCWVVLSDSYHHTACLSLPGQLVNAFHVTPGELGHQLGPNKTPWVNTHTDKAEPATAALYIFKDKGKNPTLCDCS